EINNVIENKNIIAQSWKELSPSLWAQVKMSGQFSWILFLFVFVAMAFGIVNSFLMEIFDRIKELGIMMSLGTRPSNIFLMLIFEAFFLGVGGSIVGGILGVFLVNVVFKNQVDFSMFSQGMQFMGIGNKIPLIVSPAEIALCMISTALVVVIATLYPAIRGAMFKPVEALRHI
ncbi:MAG: ABC transporter permease, partial [Vulcanimicrobiota bacterium]